MQAEQLSEQRRLLYVAMTRAIFKLYVPRIKKPRRTSGYLGPLGTVLLPALELAAPEIKLGEMIVDVVTPPTRCRRRNQGEEIGRRSRRRPAPLRIDGPLFPPLDADLGTRRIITRSFSSMARHHLMSVGEAVSFGEQAAPVEDETAAPLEGDDPLRGPVFGDMVHCVLEEVDFDEVGKAASAEDLCTPAAPARNGSTRRSRAKSRVLRTRTPTSQLEEACRRQIAQLVWLALRTPLSPLGGPLCQIKKEDRLSEIEFLYPEIDGPPPTASSPGTWIFSSARTGAITCSIGKPTCSPRTRPSRSSAAWPIRIITGSTSSTCGRSSAG